MEIAMLWRDDEKGVDFNTKLERVTTYYKKKYGAQPNLCFVNPAMEPPEKVGNVEIRESSTIQNNHFWIGVSGD